MTTGPFSPNKGREFAVALWEFVAFLANSVVFLLIGVELASMPFGASEAFAIFVAIGVVLLSRAVTIYPLSLLFAPTRWAIPRSEQHVLWWGGLRGALALALALSLPDLAAASRRDPGRGLRRRRLLHRRAGSHHAVAAAPARTGRGRVTIATTA